MNQAIQRYVDRLRRRSPLSDAAVADLLALDPPEVECSANWDLVRPGQTVEFACLVASGIVGRWEQFSDGSRGIAAVYVPGDMCDLHSVPVPVASWGITPLCDSVIVEVPHRDLRRLFDRHHDLAIAFWRDTIADASILAKMVTAFNGLPARRRVAHILCELGLRLELAGCALRDNAAVPLTQSQLAEIVGVSSVHMSRILRALVDEEAIRTERGEVRIADRALLERIAEFDERYLLLTRTT